MVCFSIHNRQHESIEDAEVLLNGENILFRQGYGYCIENIPPPPYHLLIRHAGYLDAVYDNISGLYGRLYLMRDGEDYYYQQGLKIPVLRRRDALLVVLSSVDKSGERIGAAAARSNLEKFLAANRMKILISYGDVLKTLKSPGDRMTGTSTEYSYLVSRTDGKLFDDDVAELQILRSDPTVEAAGPALITYENDVMPRAYGCTIQVRFATDVDEHDALERLKKAGYSDSRPFYSDNLRLYRVQLPAETGMSMNMHVEHIAAIDGVVESEPEITLYQ